MDTSKFNNPILGRLINGSFLIIGAVLLASYALHQLMAAPTSPNETVSAGFPVVVVTFSVGLVQGIAALLPNGRGRLIGDLIAIGLVVSYCSGIAIIFGGKLDFSQSPLFWIGFALMVLGPCAEDALTPSEIGANAQSQTAQSS
jgi:hypothetical protein